MRLEQNNTEVIQEWKKIFKQLQQHKTSENTNIVELRKTDSTEFDSPTITESVTTKKTFQLPTEIVTQIMLDSKKQISLEISKLESKYQDMLNQFSEHIQQTQISQKHEINLEQKIVDDIREYLVNQFKGIHVAITYDGKVIDSDISKIKIMKRVKKMEIPSEQIFLYAVPLK